MKRLKIAALVLSAFLVSGCNNIRGFKLLLPEHFGLTPIRQNVYIEAGADEDTKTRLLYAMKTADKAMRAAYGDVQSRPIIHACITEKCYASFGGMGSRAKVYGDHILLSPRGLNWHFLAHEWSHDELRTRLSFPGWWHLPHWFDEGLAVTVSEAPEHSEAHWQFLVAAGIKRPTRAELMSYKSLRQWLDAVQRYGETQNAERKARGEPEIRPVYTAAGHEVRPWFAGAGTQGLLELIRCLNAGATFEDVYPTTDKSK